MHTFYKCVIVRNYALTNFIWVPFLNFWGFFLKSFYNYSGNVQGKLKKASPRRGRTRGRPTNRKSIPESTPEESSESSEKSIPDLGESSEELFPATSTQIENTSRPRRSRRSQ